MILATSPKAWLVAAAGAALCAMGAVLQPWNFFPGYLQALTYWAALSLGCVGLLLIHGLTGGQWGVSLRPILRAGSRTVPWIGVAVLPLFAGLRSLYPWANEAVIAEHAIVAAKRAYLNVPFFAARTALYLAVWVWLSRLVLRPTEERTAGKSGVGLLCLALTMSFAAFDWLMSTEPEWFSSLYGAIYIVGALVSTFSFSAIWLAASSDATDRERHDLGKLMFMSIMLWGYLSFSQYLIIWSGQIPEELTWYQHRGHGLWKWVGGSLILGMFVLPFFLLLSQRAKKSARLIAHVGVFLLAMRAIETAWLVRPAYAGVIGPWPVWEPAAYVALGAAWIALFLRPGNGLPWPVRPAPRPAPRAPEGPQDQPIRRPGRGASK